MDRQILLLLSSCIAVGYLVFGYQPSPPSSVEIASLPLSTKKSVQPLNLPELTLDEVAE